MKTESKKAVKVTALVFSLPFLLWAIFMGKVALDYKIVPWIAFLNEPVTKEIYFSGVHAVKVDLNKRTFSSSRNIESVVESLVSEGFEELSDTNKTWYTDSHAFFSIENRMFSKIEHAGSDSYLLVVAIDQSEDIINAFGMIKCFICM